MIDVHEKLGVVNELEPLSETELTRRFGLLHADNLFYAGRNAHMQLTREEKHQWIQTKAELSELAATTIPRITSRDLGGIGLEYVPGARVLHVTLF